MGSRGSVIPFFISKRKEGVLPITNAEMTRFNISLQAGVDLVMYSLANHLGGEIFIPKIPSYKVLDIATAIAPDCKIEIVGVRPGEKIHEEMITDTDSLNTIDLGNYFAILPSVSFNYDEKEYMRHHKAKKVPFGFRYNSGSNSEWETVESLRKLIVEHVDSGFRV
jgi:UDP-N-acetylglucosamine 4,6-dehydratase